MHRKKSFFLRLITHLVCTVFDIVIILYSISIQPVEIDSLALNQTYESNQNL